MIPCINYFKYTPLFWLAHFCTTIKKHETLILNNTSLNSPSCISMTRGFNDMVHFEQQNVFLMHILQYFGGIVFS
jgi:hypothetical protein